MAEYSSFFNSVVDGAGIYDREYNAEDFAEYFASFIGNGVYANSANELMVSAVGGNMSVNVDTGSAWINGYYYSNKSQKGLTLSIADGANDRTDYIVIRLDLINREITAEISEGTPSPQATPPALQRDSDIWEIAIAKVLVPANANDISQANITDTRADNTVCGWVSGVVDQIDTTALFAQYTDAFETWFEGIQGTLDGDIAGALANRISAIENDTTINTATIAVADWVNSEVDFEDDYPADDYDIEIALSESADETAFDAWGEAKIVGNSSANSIKALGTVPAVAIPVIIKATAKLGGN